MNDESAEITHPKFRMWLRRDGVVHLVWAPQVATGLEDAIAAIDAMANLTGGDRPHSWWTRTTPARRTVPRAWSSRAGATSSRPSP